MGVLNVTPDSFSDGGKFLDPRAAVERALEMETQGARIIDMGAESTRPGSRGVPPAEQLRRLLPVLKKFRAKSRAAVSVDTQSSRVAAACLSEGAELINDISALRNDKKMASIVARAGCGVILMHMQGTPRTMQKAPRYADVLSSLGEFFIERLETCERAGIERGKIWLDPGIGFGKTFEHNLDIIRKLRTLTAFERPLVVGVSRKSFLGTLTGETVPEKRVTASVMAGMIAIQNGAAVLRVHDVAEHAAALRVMDAMAPASRI